MKQTQLPDILEPDRLQSLLGNPAILIVDLSDIETYQTAHIPGAIHLPYEQLCDSLPTAPGELPTSAPLAQTLNQIGLQPDQHVVAYDNDDGTRACRLLWTLDIIGHKKSSLLNGGLTAWLAAHLTTESEINQPTIGNQQFALQPNAPIVNMLYLLQHLDSADLTLIDARTEAEYSGTTQRAKRSGHIPGAINIDHRRLFSSSDKHLKPDAELKAIFKPLNLPQDQEIVCYCHTHRRSALMYITLKHLGFTNVKAYPGSWAEWGNSLDTPVS